MDIVNESDFLNAVLLIRQKQVQLTSQERLNLWDLIIGNHCVHCGNEKGESRICHCTNDE